MSFFESEALFWGSAGYNTLMAKSRTKPKRWAHGWGLAIVKPEDVLAKLQEEGIQICPRTLLNYEKWNLIPGSEHSCTGREKGRGRTTDYPEEAVAEAYASYLTKRTITMGKDDLAHVRGRMLEQLKEKEEGKRQGVTVRTVAEELWLTHRETLRSPIKLTLADLKTRFPDLENKINKDEIPTAYPRTTITFNKGAPERVNHTVRLTGEDGREIATLDIKELVYETIGICRDH